MANLTNYEENRLMGLSVDNSSTTYYVALHTADPTDVGNVGEVTATGYARQGDTFTVTGADGTNDSLITFPNQTSGGDLTITHMSIWDAVSAGNCKWQGALTASATYPDGGGFTFAAGAIDLSLA